MCTSGHVGEVSILPTGEQDGSLTARMDIPPSMVDDCSTPVACVRLDGPKSVLYANEAFCALLGYSQGEFHDIYRDGGHTLNELVHVDDRSYVNRVLDTMEPGASELMQLRLRTHDGGLRPISMVCGLSRASHDGRMAMLLHVDFHTIDYKGQATYDEYFGGVRQFIDWLVPYAVAEYTIGENGHFIFLNKYVLESLGFTGTMPERAPGMHSPLFSIFPVDTIARMTRRAFANVTESSRTAHASGYLYGIGSTGVDLDGKVIKIRGEVPGQDIYRFVGSLFSDDEQSLRTGELARLVDASSEALAVFSFEKDLTFLRCLWTRMPSELGVFASVSVNLNLDDGTAHWESVRPLGARADMARRYHDFRDGKVVPDLEEPVDFEWKVSDFSRKFSGNFLTVGDGGLYFVVRDRNEAPVTDVECDSLASSSADPEDCPGRKADGEVSSDVTRGREAGAAATDASDPPTVDAGQVERFLATVPGMESVDPTIVADVLKTLATTGKPPASLVPAVRPGVLGSPPLSFESGEDDPLGGRHVSIHTFGLFDIFVDGVPVSFKNESAKELLALIVNRRGGFVTSRKATSTLWPEEPVNKTTMARYRKAAMRLSRTLEQYGVQAILEKDGGSRRINPSLVDCDLYSYLWEGHTSLFKGRYMSEYSWAEDYLAELLYNHQGR